MKRVATILLFATLAACSNPKDTQIPKELDKMATIKPQLEKLSEDERSLFTQYVARMTISSTLGGMFGKPTEGIPDGMTIGKAIEEQKKFKEEQAAEEAKQAALKAKLQAERDAAINKMREATTVTLLKKDIKNEYGYGGILMDEKLVVSFGYKNNTEKDISGIKGTFNINDQFGEHLCGFNISNDTTIKAGGTSTWSGGRSVKYSMNGNKDRKCGEMEEGKYKGEWIPEQIVFSDGTKLIAP